MRKRLLKLADATAGALLCRLLSWATYVKPARSEPATVPPDAARSIFVARPGGMGDMVLLLPVLKLLRRKYPSARIDVACEQRNIDVLDLSSIGATGLSYDANPFRFLARLLGSRYDLAIDTEQFHNFSAVFCYLSRAPIRVGFKVNPLRNPLYTHLVNYDLCGFEGAQFLRLAETIGLATGAYNFDSVLSDLPQTGPSQPAGACVVIHPGSASRVKTWPPERYADLATRLATECDIPAVLVGVRSEKAISRRIADLAKARDSITDRTGTLSLKETAALIQNAQLFVGSDSGLAHLATALGTPTVVLFGPSDSDKWGFAGEKNAIVRNRIPCAPCCMFGYHRPCKSVACMEGITVSQVFSACQQLVGKPSPAATHP